MSLENGNAMVMPVGPAMYGGYGNNGGMFGDGNMLTWLFLLILLGWGGNRFGGYGDGAGGGSGMGGGMGMYPWMNQMNQMNDGFRDQMINDTLGNIQSGVTGIANQLCNGFAGVNATINTGFANAETSANARQMANMQQMFGIQTAINQGFNAQIAQSAQNTRDVIDVTRSGQQMIMDKLCALELDGVKGQLAQSQRDNLTLQNQLNMATFRESQTAQNALIQQGFSNEIDALYNRLSSCPVGTVPVYGSQPIFTCNNNGMPCGCNS